MTLFVRYCSKHRHAWPVADRWRPGDPCPIWREALGERATGDDCAVRTVDAAAQINALGAELEGERSP